MTCSKPCYFPFNVNCFFFLSVSLFCTLIHSQSRMIKIMFCSLSFRSTLISLILVSFWFILPYSVVILPRSVIFRYHSCLFDSFPCHSVLFQSHSALFWHIPLFHSQSRMIKIMFCSLSFWSTLISFILVSFWFILPYSVVIPPHSGIFRYHSCLLRLSPVSFAFIPESFCLVPAYSTLSFTV